MQSSLLLLDLNLAQCLNIVSPSSEFLLFYLLLRGHHKLLLVNNRGLWLLSPLLIPLLGYQLIVGLGLWLEFAWADLHYSFKATELLDFLRDEELVNYMVLILLRILLIESGQGAGRQGLIRLDSGIFDCHRALLLFNL